ncbi:MAG: ADP-ribosylglycohydrolase family protein [Candidatus Bathyarchaeota archaeon]|nr:ADP-ribosylglycohydrolase family protein [Candidatus Bathyarchaeota archaeon]
MKTLVSLEELKRLLDDEIVQRKEEGYDVAEVERRLSESDRKNTVELEGFWKELEGCHLRPDFHYNEPPDLKGIEAERPKEAQRLKARLSDDELYDKIYGGWLGRCAGCLLGKPVEGLRKEQIQKWLEVADAYPLEDYFPPILPLPDDSPKWLSERLSSIERSTRKTGRGVLLGQIDGMARDDDTDYTIMGLHILETHGFEFTTMNVGESWLYLLPYWRVYTAERVAYRNLVNGLLPPESATFMNPYREWIGAQIRADMWGYATPGRPYLAAEFAFRDARLSHVKNGIYGEMFVSAMVSAAFTTDDIDEIIDAGLSAIPKSSRLTEAVRDTLNWGREYDSWEDAWIKVMDKYGQYHSVHTINNAAIVVLGLIYGEGDYGKSISIGVMGGLDTDCNGATVGSILGVILGAKGLPEKWIVPLKDRIESFVIGYNGSRISELADRTFGLAKRSPGGS